MVVQGGLQGGIGVAVEQWGFVGVFIVISYMFAGTISGMSVGMVASAIVSIWLWFDPPKFLQK